VVVSEERILFVECEPPVVEVENLQVWTLLLPVTTTSRPVGREKEMPE
jgi:hypothetical protein